jgi:hypothetical protein
MSAGQPAKPLVGLAPGFPPLSGLRPTPLFFPIRAPASRSGFAPAHRKPVGSGARSRSHAFPRFRRGRPWAGSAPTTGGTPAPVSPTHGSLLLQAGGTLTSASPTIRKLPSQVGGTRWFPSPTGLEPLLTVGVATRSHPPQTGTGSSWSASPMPPSVAKRALTGCSRLPRSCCGVTRTRFVFKNNNNTHTCLPAGRYGLPDPKGLHRSRQAE